MKRMTCDLADCIHDPLKPAVLEECRSLARREADYRRETSGPDQHDYVRLQDDAERVWHRRAVECKRDHGSFGIAHPGCVLCPYVHGLPYEMVG